MSGGKGNEAWYESRRIWAAGLALLATVISVALPQYESLAVPIFGALATILGVTSWSWPK